MEKCIICLNQCLIPYKPKLNCECKYIVHKKCFMHWWKENNNCLICLKHTNLGMKQADIYRRRLNNRPQFDVIEVLQGVTILTNRRRNNIWREISNHVDLDDNNFPVLPIRAYLHVFKCLVYVFIIIVLSFYAIATILYY